MKAKWLLCGVLFLGGTAIAAEAEYCPTAYTKIGMNGNGVLEVWGVSSVPSNQALLGNPDGGWPTEMSIAVWRDAIKTAKEESVCVTMYYDPSTFEIWSISE